MQEALHEIAKLQEQARRVSVYGNREYNGGWHTALDLPNLLTVSEAITRAAIERKESRGAHFRDDYPDKSEECAKFNIIIRQGPDGEMQVTREPLPEMKPELKQVIEEMK
jgi:succinate dehydrogenase / fumarate reductase flavoprotein subunit